MRLPARPLTILWQSTLVDVEPATRYGHRYDGAAVNTTLAVVNDSGGPLEFPLILATTDPEERDTNARPAPLPGADPDPEWETLAAAIRASGLRRGYSGERLDAYLVRLRSSVRRAQKSRLVELAPGEQRFVRTYERRLLLARDGALEFRSMTPLPQFALAPGGVVSVVVALPGDTEQFRVEVGDYARTLPPQPFGTNGASALAGRPGIAWTGPGDAELWVRYRYVG